VFTGRNAIVLDAKGRLTVPARFRDALQLQCQGRLTLTMNVDPCLRLLPREIWAAQAERLASPSPGVHRNIARLLLSSALDVELDSAGRILIPAELREPAFLAVGEEVMLAGVGRSFEIWSPEHLKQADAEAARAAQAMDNLSLD
jgi:MraZ protein